MKENTCFPPVRRMLPVAADLHNPLMTFWLWATGSRRNAVWCLAWHRMSWNSTSAAYFAIVYWVAGAGGVCSVRIWSVLP